VDSGPMAGRRRALSMGKWSGAALPPSAAAGRSSVCQLLASRPDLVDIADPFAPREVGHFLPDSPDRTERVSSNDVTIDDRGLIYLVDRVRGVDIIETTAFG
jgi:hypothetical protein